MDFQSLIEKIDQGKCTLSDFEKVALHTRSTLRQVFDKTAIYFAKAFMNDEMDFDSADYALECIHSALLDSSNEDFQNTIAFPIYIAFDAGEYPHGDGKDPVKTYTIPQLQEIFKELGENSFIE
jgi:hypothetical protein